MESWESLDIDDSDLPSLVRPSPPKTLLPCKRSHLSTTTTTLKPCSQTQTPQPQTLDSQSQPPQQSQTPQFELPKESAPPTTSKPLFKIPGPAGAIQSAMHRKALNEKITKENFSSTQDYMMRALQEDGMNGDEDDDFKLNPWLCALGFVNADVGNSSTLESIKNCRTSVNRFPQVVAIVKSCSPNGLGDLVVKLKDPTGTIGANIHRRVLIESEFGKDISVGCVLILHKVAVFSPSPSTHYLNITLNNITKIISKDSGPPSSNRRPATPVRPAASVTGMIKKPPSVRLGTAKVNTNENVRGYTKGSVDVEKQSYNLVAGRFSCTINSSSYQHTVVDVEPLGRQKVAIEAAIEPSKSDDNDKENNVANNGSQAEVIPSGSLNCSRNLSQHASSSAKSIGSNPGEGEIGRASGVMKQRPQLISKTILPEWTDEQLEELLAASSDDW